MNHLKPLGLVSLTILLSACSGTRPGYLGNVNTEITPCPSSPNCVSSLASEDEDHKISALTYQDKEEAHARLTQIINKNPAAELIVESPNYLYAEYTSSVMKYVDDVEFLFEDTSNTIQVRSASRLGHSDFGVNLDRIEEIRQQLAGQEERYER